MSHNDVEEEFWAQGSASQAHLFTSLTERAAHILEQTGRGALNAEHAITRLAYDNEGTSPSHSARETVRSPLRYPGQYGKFVPPHRPIHNGKGKQREDVDPVPDPSMRGEASDDEDYLDGECFVLAHKAHSNQTLLYSRTTFVQEPSQRHVVR